jgi:surface polysaccharide O-acyltransferase-like enzyme
MWPGGPAWFLWLLLAFDCITALLLSSRPSWATKLGRVMELLAQRPLLAYVLLVACGVAFYIPLSMIFPAASWTTMGPFALQTSRILHYFVYFIFGVAIGLSGIDGSIIASNSKLAAKWWVASTAAVVIFILYMMSSPFAARPGASPFWAIGFVLSCAASCFAFLAIFSRFMQVRRPAWDSLAINSFGIYVVHYAFVCWLQYALLPVYLPGFAKCLIVFLAALLLSWTATIALRRSPAISCVI